MAIEMTLVPAPVWLVSKPTPKKEKKETYAI